ncbi:hypothetical protein [Ochrobactrum sp. BTU2]|uniref:hypothetical protein n=1 Tax=Ochrobactrum sp. BTU2 TaxID=2856166 RepID=UPI00211A72E9|nr:hypothetical protein [Ochrobactrum sp. BTU2]MCQ9146111.1 hypothetical protein [Ochrobactrum sp. BTU2]
MKKWKLELGQTVTLAMSGEQGVVVGRAEYEIDEDRYLVRYKAGDGRLVENWWPESAIG